MIGLITSGWRILQRIQVEVIVLCICSLAGAYAYAQKELINKDEFSILSDQVIANGEAIVANGEAILVMSKDQQILSLQQERRELKRLITEVRTSSDELSDVDRMLMTGMESDLDDINDSLELLTNE